jgi:outer membrane immunogenic protein
MRKYILAALLAGTAATPAMAQEAAPFTGLRAEGIVGYESTEFEDEGSNGVAYGVGVGYDFQMGGAVAGVEAEISDSTVDECIDDIDVAGDELCVQSGRDIYVGGRVGGLVTPRTLIYAKAGYVNGRVNVEYDAPGTANDEDDGANLDGVRVGAGAEFALGPNSYTKAEYRYSNYEAGFDKHQGVVGFGFRF